MDVKKMEISVKIENEEKSVKTFEEILKEIGFGCVQIEIAFVVNLVLFTVLNETMGISFILPAAECDLNLDSKSKGILSSMTFIGIMISSLFWGYYADTQGRRLAMLHALTYASIFTTLSLFVQDLTLFAICRFMTGIFAAGYSIALYPYVGEFNSIKHRSATVTAICLAIGSSAILQPLIALWILSYDWKIEIYEGFLFRPWRLLLFVYALPGIISGIWLLIRLPESPKFYLAINENEKSLEVLRWMFKVNKGNDKTLNVTAIDNQDGMIITQPVGLKATLKSICDQIFPLLKPPHFKYFFACCFMLFGIFVNIGGVALFLPDTLNQLSKSNRNSTTLCEVLSRNTEIEVIGIDEICDDSVDPSTYIDSSYLGLAFFIGYLIVSFVNKKLGRRKISVFTLLTSTICGFLLTVVTQHYLIVTLYCFFIMLCGVNVAIVNGASVDLFPTHLRSMAVCISMLMGRFGTAIASYLIGLFIETHCILTYNLVSGLTLILFFVQFLIPDSK